jgi:hypothetical protein
VLSAYVYKWVQKSTEKWYLGSRTGKNCHPNDGYICSSRIVKPMILADSLDWERTILCIGNSEDMLALEVAYLQLIDAKNDPMSFNQHNGDGKFVYKGGVPQTEEHKLKLSLSKKGRTVWNKGKKENRNDVLGKMSKSHLGKQLGPHDEETKIRISNSLKGRVPWNKGKKFIGVAKAGSIIPIESGLNDSV